MPVGKRLLFVLGAVRVTIVYSMFRKPCIYSVVAFTWFYILEIPKVNKIDMLHHFDYIMLSFVCRKCWIDLTKTKPLFSK